MTQADFISRSAPDPIDLPDGPPTGPDRFFNCALSRLLFNWRVLDEARNPGVPLLERVRFLAISAANLDEFSAAHMGDQRGLETSGRRAVWHDGLTAGETLTRANPDADMRKLLRAQQTVWRNLRAELEAEGITIISRENLGPADQAAVRRYFHAQVLPVLSPRAIDPAHPFPFVPNDGFCLALQLRRSGDDHEMRAILPVPSQIARFVPLPGGQRFLPVEDLLLSHLDALFPGYSEVNHCAFRVQRGSGLAETSGSAPEDLPDRETGPSQPRQNNAMRLQLSADAPADLRDLLAEGLGVAPANIVTIDGLIGLADVGELVLDQRRDLQYPGFIPRIPERVQDHNGDLFAAIRQADLLLHHPYETFDTVVRFLVQAARDPDVLAIKQTLYRTSHDSPLVDALCEAARSGKSVTAVIELKAQAEGAANARQARRLERAGAHVVYGFVNYQTHAKISSVVRREGDRLVTYTHFGTGDDRPDTARTRTDLSLMTSDPALGRDATRVFNFLSGYVQPAELENLAISPDGLKDRLLELIAHEAELARQGRPAAIWAKMNGLTDPQLIDALYAAGQAGVHIELVIRGVCTLRPGIAGLSGNIRVKSIVGRLLEHSRIMCFGSGHGLPDRRARVFVSSADWMSRNFDHRVETLVECHNETVKAQIVTQIMVANLADEASSWVLQPDGRYIRHLPQGRDDVFSAHEFLMKTPSVSGLRSTNTQDIRRLARDVPALTGPSD